MNILIVEDDRSLARLLKQAVEEAGYQTQVEGNGNDALDAALLRTFDLILLDVMLPGIDGFDVCRRLRAEKVMSPVLMITAKDTLDNKVDGLDSGADDYIVKPVAIRELLARVRALLRRGPSLPSVLKVADLTFDPSSRRVERAGRLISLSATEHSLLEYLLRNAGRVLTRSMILEHVWDYDFEGNDNILDVYVGYLRGKIDKNQSSALIHTVRGVGFCLEERDEA